MHCIIHLFCSVPIPFVSDRLRLQGDAKWAKIVGVDKREMRIVWSDNVRKLNRTDAKVNSEFSLVVSV